MFTKVILCWIVLDAFASSAYRNTDQDHRDPTVSFDREVRPIFVEHCLACHGGVKRAAGLSFVYEEQVVSADSWIVEPGDPDESLLIERIVSRDPDFVMPPPDHGKALTDQEVGVLRRWITQGATWEKHWAFRPPKAHSPPAVKDTSWPKNEIDRFVLGRLEERQIEPSVDAPPSRWLRRVTLDLVGLAPTIGDRQRFLDALRSADSTEEREAIYSTEVDRLLASPRYGERWASVWLDQVRYADSKGLGVDGRRNIWKFRDWVIDALNRDLPYDQFTIKQIAGDLVADASLEDLIATAVHRLTQSNDEGGTDDEEFRVAAVLDRVNTTWQAWQGLTFGCAQCHSHPYEPIQHDEYYQFAAFFNNTSDADLGQDWPVVQVPLKSSDYTKARELDKKIESTIQEIWQQEFGLLRAGDLWQHVSNMSAKTNNPTRVVVENLNGIDQFRTDGTVSSNTKITIRAALPDDLERLSAIKLNVLPLDREFAERDSEWGFVLSHVSANLYLPGSESPVELKLSDVIIDEPFPFFDPGESLSTKSQQGFGAYTRMHYPRKAAFVLENAVELSAGSKLEVDMNHRVFLLSAFPLVAKRGFVEVTGTTRIRSLIGDEAYLAKRRELNKLKLQRKKIKSTPLPILRERPGHLKRPQHVFVRGLFLEKDKQVFPGTPRDLSIDSVPQNATRMELANWMVSAQNPLTARVAVNRIWARLFGVGIVATEEDFGASGEKPSHPKLLDYLATQFQGSLQWSQKRLIKSIVLSRTYRQQSVVRKELDNLDPQNRWLARGPRHRLAAEVVRDQALAFAGLLNFKMYGPPSHPPIDEAVWKPFEGGDRWSTPDVGDAERYRRAIYTYTKRSIPYPMFAAFDSPSREFCQPRRLRSNTPIQALTLLNEQTFVDCSHAFAERIFASGRSQDERLINGFLMATCREPSTAELQACKELMNEATTDESAYRLVASILLNLDEVLSK